MGLNLLKVGILVVPAFFLCDWLIRPEWDLPCPSPSQVLSLLPHRCRLPQGKHPAVEFAYESKEKVAGTVNRRTRGSSNADHNLLQGSHNFIADSVHVRIFEKGLHLTLSWRGEDMIRFVSLALLFWFGAADSASVILVPDSASTIQAAIDLAATGDTIQVAAGVYQENLVLQGKALTLEAPAGADATFLEPAAPSEHTIFCDSTGGISSLTGFTVRNGGNVETVWIGQNAPMTISYCVFHDNIDHISSPLTVIMCNSSATIAFNVFYNNSGINCIMAYAPSRILNNTIDGNSRGIYTNFGGVTTVAINNSITNNTDYGVAGHYDTLANNNVWGNGEGNLPGTNGLSADPLYVDRNSHNYRLQPGSPNIDRALAATGFPGPLGPITDIGAFQQSFLPPYADSLRIVGEDLLHVTNPALEIEWSYYDTSPSTQAAYELELWTDSTTWPYHGLLWSTGQVSSGDSIVMYPGDSLQISRSYRLRVRVHNGTAWGDWRERLFRMNSPPPVPTLLYPADMDTLGQKFSRLAVNSVPDFEGDTVWYGYELYTDAALIQLVSAGSLYVARTTRCSAPIP